MPLLFQCYELYDYATLHEHLFKRATCSHTLSLALSHVRSLSATGPEELQRYTGSGVAAGLSPPSPLKLDLYKTQLCLFHMQSRCSKVCVSVCQCVSVYEARPVQDTAVPLTHADSLLKGVRICACVCVCTCSHPSLPLCPCALPAILPNTLSRHVSPALASTPLPQHPPLLPLAPTTLSHYPLHRMLST
jgi:hypothetical protein